MPPPRQRNKISSQKSAAISPAFANIPCSYEASIRGHSKAVGALDIDRSGSRMATGSEDYVVRLWDFHGMTKSMNSFKIVEPSSQQPIRAISWSPTANNFLVCTAGNQPTIFTREGDELVDCVRGDMYLRDLAHTKGHTSLVTDG